MPRPAKRWRDWPIATLELKDAPNMKRDPRVDEILKYLREQIFWESERHLAYTTIWSWYQQEWPGKVYTKYHFCIHPYHKAHLSYLALKYGLKIETSFNEQGLRVDKRNIVMGKKRGWDP